MVVPSKMRRNIGEIIEEYNQTFYPMSQSDTFLRIRENPPIGGQQMIRTHLEQFLIMIVRNETESNKNRLFPSKESMENHIISQIAEMIDENMYSKFSVDDICQSMSYSRAYISKLFKVTTGYTPLEYILKKKIGEAKRLIREDKLNFTQISDVLCFDNPHYFSTVFKKETGMSPKEYKSRTNKTESNQ
jgi:AraC-like DNA-binding protein